MMPKRIEWEGLDWEVSEAREWGTFDSRPRDFLQAKIRPNSPVYMQFSSFKVQLLLAREYRMLYEENRLAFLLTKMICVYVLFISKLDRLSWPHMPLDEISRRTSPSSPDLVKVTVLFSF